MRSGRQWLPGKQGGCYGETPCGFETARGRAGQLCAAYGGDVSTLRAQQRGDVRHAGLRHGPGRLGPARLGADEPVRAGGRAAAPRAWADVGPARAALRDAGGGAGLCGAVRAPAPMRRAVAGRGPARLPGRGAGGVPPVRVARREPHVRARARGRPAGRRALCGHALAHGGACGAVPPDRRRRIRGVFRGAVRYGPGGVCAAGAPGRRALRARRGMRRGCGP